MASDKLLNKIQALLKKAESAQELGNVHEAAAFSAKVNELLTTHNLAMADLSVEDESEVNGERYDDLGVSHSMGKWTVNLLSVLCQYNYCGAMYHEKFKGSKVRMNRKGKIRVTRQKESKMEVTIAGKPENVEVVKYLFDVLKSQFERMAKDVWKQRLEDYRNNILEKTDYTKDSDQYKKPWKYFRNAPKRQKIMTSFFYGAVNGVYLKLEEKKKEAEAAHGNKITDLILHNDAAVQEWMAEAFPNSGNFRSTTRKVDGRAYAKGEEAGKNASMAKGVATGETVSTKFLQ